MYKNIICLFCFLYLEMNEMVKWEREPKTAKMYTHGKMRIFSEQVRSAFVRLEKATLRHWIIFLQASLLSKILSRPSQGTESL